ncbi:MAG: FMN-binding negative transcriptional regulator [Stellaceae bacterium]
MYMPPHFAEDRVPVLHRAMRDLAFATLVTSGPGGMVAGHFPMLIEAEPRPFGSLHGHMARANPQFSPRAQGAPAGEALAIFLGPNAYVTPSWYPTKHETGKVVPTWNYLAIHAYGRLGFIDDPAAILAHLQKLTARHEGERAAPWSASDAPADYIARMVVEVVGFRLAITRLEGKWKMSQNRPPADRDGVIAGLAGEGGAAEQAVAEIMKGRG